MKKTNKKIEIKGLVLNIGGKDTSLTIKEAKKLKEVLDELFRVEVKETHHHYDNGFRGLPIINYPYVSYTLNGDDMTWDTQMTTNTTVSLTDIEDLANGSSTAFLSAVI